MKEEIIIFEFVGSEQKQRTYIWRNNHTSESHRLRTRLFGKYRQFSSFESISGYDNFGEIRSEDGHRFGSSWSELRSGIIPSRPDKIVPHGLIEQGTS